MLNINLTSTEESVLNRIKYYIEKDEKANISTIAKDTYVSPATINTIIHLLIKHVAATRTLYQLIS